MKRIVVLIDGTWNKEGSGADTNVAKLDARQHAPFIKPVDGQGTPQHVFYHDGVGSDGDLAKKLLGGAWHLSEADHSTVLRICRE